MSKGLATAPTGVIVFAGPARRHGALGVCRSVAGTARGLVGPTSVLASCVSLQCAAALATTTFATFGAAGTGALRFVAGAIALLGARRRRDLMWAIAAAGGVVLLSPDPG